jgi:hypothetical protein
MMFHATNHPTFQSGKNPLSALMICDEISTLLRLIDLHMPENVDDIPNSPQEDVSSEDSDSDYDEGLDSSMLPAANQNLEIASQFDEHTAQPQEHFHRCLSETSLEIKTWSLKGQLHTDHMSKSLPNMRGCSRSIHNRGVGLTILDSVHESCPDTGRQSAMARVAEFDRLLEGL